MAKSTINTISKLKPKRSTKLSSLLSFAAIFAAIGVFTLFHTFAAPASNGKSIEAETASTSQNVAVVADATASSGNYLEFRNSTPAPPPPPPADAGICTGRDSNGGVPSDKFPGSACTGVPSGTTLKTVPGQVNSGQGWNWEGAPFNYLKITGSGAVLDSLDINGCVFVDVGVTNLTIKKTRISGACNYIIRLYQDNAAVGITMSDVEIDGKGNGAVGFKGPNFSFTRLNVHGFTGKAIMSGSNTLLEDSFIHDNACFPPDHQSAIGTNGGASNIIMRHNNVDLTPSECTSGGIANYDDFGAFSNVLIEKNLINSGGYCLKAGFEDNNAAGNSGMRVLNNVFGRKYFPQCGSFGVVSSWMPSVSGNVWSGNSWGGGAASNSSHAVGDVVSP